MESNRGSQEHKNKNKTSIQMHSKQFYIFVYILFTKKG